MFAPWPTNRLVSLVLLPCLMDSSAESTAITVWTVYLPLTAVQVPMFTFVLAPEASDPLNEPFSVVTVAPLLLSSVMVTACEPLPDAIVPWFFTVTVKVTVLPADGVLGVQATAEATRSELCTGVTMRLVGLV